MIPLKPFSVKLNDEERALVREMSEIRGCTDGKTIRDALKAIHQMVHAPGAPACPYIVEVMRFTLQRRKLSPVHSHDNETPSSPASTT